MANTDLAIRIATQLDSAGFNKASTGIKSLTKTAARLGTVLGVSLSAAAIISFGKKSVRAYADAEHEASVLANTVKNLGLSFAQSDIDLYIGKIGKLYGITGQQAVPAFQALLSATGSVNKSIGIFNTALDIAASKNMNVTDVAKGLSQAYLGNTKALKKYDTGLTAAELSSKSFVEIQAILDKRFSGAATDSAKTFTGQMKILTEASNKAQEVIGKSLIDAMISFSGQDGVAGLADSMSNAADQMARFVDNVTYLKEAVGSIPGMGIVSKLFDVIGSGIGHFSLGNLVKQIKILRKEQSTSMSGVSHLYELQQPQRQAAAAKAEAAAAKRNKAIVDAQKKNTAELKKQAALKKISKVFDLDQIQLIAALKGKVSEEDKIRLQAQLAYLNGNEIVASQLTKQILMSQDATGNLYKLWQTLPEAKNPFAYLDEWLLNFQRQLALTKFPTPSAPVTVTTSAGVTTTSVAPISGAVSGFTPTYVPPAPAATAGQTGFTGPIPIELKITGDGDLTNTIAKNLMQQSLSSGNQTYINRRTGGFE